MIKNAKPPDLTNTIIELIKTDNVYDFKEKWIQQEEKKKLLENKPQEIK